MFILDERFLLFVAADFDAVEDRLVERVRLNFALDAWILACSWIFALSRILALAKVLPILFTLRFLFAKHPLHPPLKQPQINGFKDAGGVGPHVDHLHNVEIEAVLLRPARGLFELAAGPDVVHDVVAGRTGGSDDGV
jgi:hypothetical protein